MKTAAPQGENEVRTAWPECQMRKIKPAFQNLSAKAKDRNVYYSFAVGKNYTVAGHSSSITWTRPFLSTMLIRTSGTRVCSMEIK